MGQHSDMNSFKQLAIAERDMRTLTCHLILSGQMLKYINVGKTE